MLIVITFYFLQVWHIPLTWLVGLMCGALLPFTQAFAISHFITVAGVASTCMLSVLCLEAKVSKFPFLQRYLAKASELVAAYGVEQVVYTMISIRLLPGSPNYVYNIVLPHVESIKLRHILIGSTVGQAPYNLFVT